MRAIEFFPDVLRLAVGIFEGQVFTLHPSQKFIVGSLLSTPERKCIGAPEQKCIGDERRKVL